MSNEDLVNGNTIKIRVGFEVDDAFENYRIRIIQKNHIGYWIAALPEAIRFSKAEVCREIFRVCPVLYLEYNDCAIILAQCGDFPREVEAVEFAKMLAQGSFGNQN